MVEWFSQFIQDMIHMTEGEKLITYWYVWGLMILYAFAYCSYKTRK